MNIYNFSTQLENINLIRNFYGEQLGFLFLFTAHLLRWVSVPAVVGIIVYIVTVSATSKNIVFSEINVVQIVLFIYTVFIAIWSNFSIIT